MATGRMILGIFMFLAGNYMVSDEEGAKKEMMEITKMLGYKKTGIIAILLAGSGAVIAIIASMLILV